MKPIEILMLTELVSKLFIINCLNIVSKYFVFLGSELFVKGIPEGVQEKKLTNFFKKQDIKFESLKLLDRKGQVMFF